METITDLSPYYPHVMLGIMVTARLGGLFMFAPVISSDAFPSQVKVALLLALTAATYPAVLPSMLAVNPDVLSMPFTLFNIATVLAMEFLLGVVIGYVASLPLMAAQLAGLFVGQQMGVALAEEYDPASGVNSNVISHMLYYLAVISFLMLGGAELVVLAVLRSFETVPGGGFRTDQSIIDWLSGLLNASFSLALRLAAPVLCMLTLESVSLGFINKTAQAFNIMSLGFPIRVIIGFLLLIISVQAICDVMQTETVEVLDGIFVVLENWAR